VSQPLGSIRLRFTQGVTSSIVDVDLSSAQTVGDIRSLIQSQAPGVRVDLNAAGTGIDVFNEISGVRLGIEEVAGGADTATELGIRSLSASTAISEFNNGRGVGIVDGAVNPVTGVADRQYNRDFRVTLGTGQAFDVDLRPQDLVSVQTVLDRINQEFADAVANPPLVASAPALNAGDFTAQLTDGANGIAFVQTVGPGGISVEKLNNSASAEQLGLLGGSYDATSATLVAQDRAQVRVNNLFSTLIDLRDALRGNSTAGITLAGEELETATDRLAEARALVGTYSNRVARATTRQEDLSTLDEQLRSGVQDLDYSEAAIRFNLLRTQLQAALQSGSQQQGLSLLDFLG
jgi:flagellin-like hook-associated protein FlgL